MTEKNIQQKIDKEKKKCYYLTEKSKYSKIIHKRENIDNKQ